MKRLSIEERAKTLGCAVDGVSICATSRIAGCDKKPVLCLLGAFGQVCQRFHNEHVHNVKALRVQCDEIWSCSYAKEDNSPQAGKGMLGLGNVWTWTALCADSELLISYNVGLCDAKDALHLMNEMHGRLANRVQLTPDGHKAYLFAVDETFGSDIDYAMLVKLYGEASNGGTPERKFSPGKCCGTRKRRITGNPVLKDASTSYVERMNLNVRMGMSRFTRLTNAFSKKIENHIHALAIYFMY